MSGHDSSLQIHTIVISINIMIITIMTKWRRWNGGHKPGVDMPMRSPVEDSDSVFLSAFSTSCYTSQQHIGKLIMHA